MRIRGPGFFLPIILALLLALLGLRCSGGPDGPPTTTTTTTTAPAPSGSLTALTYNVAGLPEGLSGSEPATNMPLIAPLLNDYDLVLLQETWKTPDPNPLAPLRVYHEILEAGSTHPFRSVSASHPLGTDPQRPQALLGDGLNRFSDVDFEPVTRVRWVECFGGIDTSDGGAGDCLALKGFSVAPTTLADGVVVDVYNLHAEAGSTAEDVRISRAQYEQLTTFVQEHSAGRPVIMGGDFNLHDLRDEADRESFQILLDGTGLRDVCTELDCAEPGRIDKFLFRGGGGVTITPTSWNFETDVFVRTDGEPLSDHDALEVTFDWSLTG